MDDSESAIHEVVTLLDTSGTRPKARVDFPDSIPSILGGNLAFRWYFPHVWTQPPGTQPFALYWSEEQELGRIFPMPTPDDLRRFYVDDYYTHEVAHQNRIDPAPTIGERMRVAIAWRSRHRQLPDAAFFDDLVGGSPRRLCDVGCGDAALLADLAARGHDVLGIEPDAKARRAAADRGVATVEGSGETMPDDVPRESFDLVTMIQAFEHVSDPRQTLENLISLVRRGGTLVLETPNSACLGFRQSGPAWYHTDAGRHIWYFSETSLGRLMREAGLEVTGSYYAGYTRQFGNYWIASEQEVWDKLYGDGAAPHPRPRPSEAAAWGLLWRTLLGGQQRAYDTVGVIARKR